MKFMNGWNEIQKSVQLYLLLNGSQKSNPEKERRLLVKCNYKQFVALRYHQMVKVSYH